MPRISAIYFVFLTVLSLTFSACTPKTSTPESVSPPTPSVTDSELLQQMESDTEPDFNQEFLQLEKELQ